jgi:sulfur transfer protein SufE
MAIESDGIIAVLYPQFDGRTNADVVEPSEEVFDQLTDAIRQHMFAQFIDYAK